MKTDLFWKITSTFLAIVLGLVTYIYINDKNIVSNALVEAKEISLSVSENVSVNTLNIAQLNGKYELLGAKLDWIINAMDINGIRAKLPIPTEKNISSK